MTDDEKDLCAELCEVKQAADTLSRVIPDFFHDVVHNSDTVNTSQVNDAITNLSDSIVKYINFSEGEDNSPVPEVREGLYGLLDRGIVVNDNSTRLLYDTVKSRLSKNEHVEDGTILALMPMLVWTTTEDTATARLLVSELKENIIQKVKNLYI